MLLAADVGNTNVKLGIFDGDNLKFKLRFSTDENKTSDELAVELARRDVEGGHVRARADGVRVRLPAEGCTAGLQRSRPRSWQATRSSSRWSRPG